MSRSLATLVAAFPALLMFGLSPAVHARDFSYSYLEVMADTSTTENTADDPIGDADGTLLGVTGSWQFHESWYVRASYTTEDKDFANEVFGTRLSLDSEQTFVMVGAGHRRSLGEGTDIYFEAMGMLSDVEHLVPNVITGRGPPMLSPTDPTRLSGIDNKGLGGRVGVRHWMMSETLEIEALVERHVLDCEITMGENSGDKCPTTHETKLGLSARYHFTDNLAAGIFGSFSKHTDPNFDDIMKLGLSLRYAF